MPKRLISNWVRGFNPRVRPDYLREFYVARYRGFATALTMSNIANNAQK